MAQEKIYYIPKNLNAQFMLLSFYTIEDMVVILLLLSGGLMVTLSSQVMQALLPGVIYGALRFKWEGYTIYYWGKTGLFFLMGRTAHMHKYILFERRDSIDGDD